MNESFCVNSVNPFVNEPIVGLSQCVEGYYQEQVKFDDALSNALLLCYVADFEFPDIWKNFN